MEKEINSKKSKHGFLVFLLKTFAFATNVISDASKAVEKEKSEPTTEEIMSGERIIGSDKYEFPDQKFLR